MSKYYDQIATVDIDIQSPIVDDTSFDYLCIMGPPPASGATPVKVTSYSNLQEVEDAGFDVSGDNADPVGLAASVAFAQSPTPDTIYIAVQQPSAAATVSAQTIETSNATISSTAGRKDGLTGCEISFNEDIRKLTITLTDSIANVKNTGLFDTLTALAEDGISAWISGVEITSAAVFQKTAEYQKMAALEQGGEDVTFTVELVQDGGSEVSYKVVVTWPAADAIITAETDTEPVNSPESELEEPSETISRALATTGWYVLCTAGVDSSYYEEIAAYIEANERMFVYTEMGFFEAGEDGEDEATVGSVYYRTVGVYGRESSDQADENVPAANQYMNVAFTAKWLSNESGSETAAFKALSSVYPAELTTGELSRLKAANLCYFITVGSKNITMHGATRAGEWADVIRFRDWLKNDMQVRVVNLFVVRPKVPYTDKGIALVQNAMEASLKAGQDAGGIAETEYDENGNAIVGYKTSVPLASSLSASEKASRKLTNCKFMARLAGAIHFAEITGSLTYEL